MPIYLRGEYFYCSATSYLAIDAISTDDLSFMNEGEINLVEKLRLVLRNIRRLDDIPKVALKLLGSRQK